MDGNEVFPQRGTVAFRFFGVCDPLPTGQLRQKKKAEIESDWTVEKHKKMASTAF
jgi:hypothetical protein